MSTPFNDQWQLPHIDHLYRAHQYGGGSETSALRARETDVRLRGPVRGFGTREHDAHEVTEKQKPPSRPGTSPPDRAPITPAEPLDNTQAEVPKVGNTDAPGG